MTRVPPHDTPLPGDPPFDAEALRRALASRARSNLRVPGFAESAVLVPILDEPGHRDGPRVILTLRPDRMRAHAGQISLPGGKRDPDDADAVATALRETEEELGVPRARFEVLGRLDDVPTPTGFNITPVVGLLRGPVELAPHAGEVAEAFLVPLSSLRAPGTYRSDGVREFLGVHYTMHEYHWERRRIWGATARILFQLLAALDAAE